MAFLDDFRRIGRSRATKQKARRRWTLETLARRGLLTAILWSSGPDLPEPRTDAVALVSPSNSVFLLGGDAANPTNTPVLSPTATGWTSGI